MANLKRACVAGSVLASFSVEKLGTNGYKKLPGAILANVW